MIRTLVMALTLAPLCALTMAAAPAEKPVDAKTKLAVELMEVTHYDRNMLAMRAQVETMMEKQFDSFATCAAALPVIREFSTEIGEKLSVTLGSDEMKIDVASIYAEVFSEDELHEILEFYGTPLGRKMLDRMPELMQKSMQISQDRLKAVMPDLQQLGEKYGERIHDAAATCKAPASTSETDHKK
jgi:hypothetical protein